MATEVEIQEVKCEMPDLVRSFGNLFHSVMKEAALSTREKELIALGMALVLRCHSCVQVHLQKAIQAGATREQILETAGVAVLMQGGPAYTQLPELLKALGQREMRRDE